MAFSANFRWPKGSKGTFSHHDLSFEPIHMPIHTLQRYSLEKLMFRKKAAVVAGLGHIRSISGTECGRNCQKAHLHAKTFHLRPLPRLSEHPLQRKSLEKLMFRKNAVLDILAKFGHFRWPKLPMTYLHANTFHLKILSRCLTETLEIEDPTSSDKDYEKWGLLNAVQPFFQLSVLRCKR